MGEGEFRPRKAIFTAIEAMSVDTLVAVSKGC